MKDQKDFIKKMLVWLCLIWFSACFAIVPDEYKANNDIQNDRENIQRIFVEIEADNDIWEQTDTSTFAELYTHFNNIFPRFPQEYTYQVVYQRCLQLTNSLGNVYNYNTFASFMDKCFSPLSSILSQIDSKYTIKAHASATPNNGPAPLTVTFDARLSSDPSNETIPSNNYYRYFRDINWEDQTIWVWPVLNYTFTEAWTYLVHLTVRSSNHNDWVFDGEKTLAINVSPKAAIINVYANSIKLDPHERQKFGTQEWLRWITFDGSTTIPVWWREILSYKWTIKSTDGFNYSKEWSGIPWIIKVVLPHNGEYTVTLTTRDNEANSISETYSVLISDPVAIIKHNPDDWNTSTNFSFDSSTSYSVMSNLRLFTREIFDSEWDRLQTYQWKNIKYQFKKPWMYTIKLTVEDELWQSNIDTAQIYVESSNPIAQYTYKESNDWKYPSKFIFDASSSSDIDAENKYDQLTYSREFSDANHTNIESVENNNEKITVSFDTVGTHTIKLIATDQYWKTNEISKEIKVQSTLRPVLTIKPSTTVRWTAMNFTVNSNENIISYTRDFWDWKKITTQTNSITHTYESAGKYEVKLSVFGENWMENELYTTVFIWNENKPIGAYMVKTNSNQILRENEECSYLDENWKATTVKAYKVNRYDNVNIDVSESLNIKWTKSDLNFYFQPRYSDIFKSTNGYKTSFKELWCTYIDFTTEDTIIWATDKKRIWFKVYNALPTLKNITLAFPQYGNESWIWFNENYVQDIFNSDYDPLIVKVTAVGANDPDGFISYYKRYYYYKDDPSRQIETKITPSEINYTYFSLPRTPGEFMFGVTLYDNDDWKITSEEILWNWPIVFFPPDTERPDIPIVTLKANKTTVDVWEEVTFDVISKIISDRADFVQERTIMYDFDWDWERDLTTKSDHVNYAYTEPSDIGYVPRAAVIYRWYQWDAKWGSIVVKDWLIPRIMYTAAWKFVLFRDVSLWEIKNSSACLSLVDCKKDNPWYLIDTSETKNFSFEYPDYGRYYVSLDIEDKYANTSNKRIPILLTWIETQEWETINYTWTMKILSIPEYQETEEGDIEISVWKSLDNSILFYILYNDPDENKTCYVDLDISDSTDKDFYCNQMYLAKFDPQFENLIWKIYYEDWTTMVTKELTISFLDYAVQLDEKTKIIYNRITKLVNGIKNDESLRALLINLQKWILSKTETESNIIAIQQYVTETEKLNITDDQKEDLAWIVQELSDSTTISAVGWSDYDVAKAEILAILPANLKVNVEQLFFDFENAKWDSELWISENDAKKEILNEIIKIIQSKISDDPNTQEADQILREDMTDIIMPNMCKILNYYSIPSEKCSSDNTKITNPNDIKAEWTTKKSALKTVLIVIWSIIWVLVLVVVWFAIKAKLQKWWEEE